MKTKIIILLHLFCYSHFIQAQEYQYHPIVTNDDPVWSYCDVIKEDIDKYDLIYSQLRFDGDTIIDNVLYKKLYSYKCEDDKTYMAALRENEKRVYVVDDNTIDELLIYDFNLQDGDIFKSPFNPYSPDYSISKIEMIEINGELRKKFYLDNGYDIWIEGIGSLNRYLPYPLTSIPLYDLGFFLNYKKENSKIFYKTDEFFFNENECADTKTNELNVNSKSIIYQIASNVYSINIESADSFEAVICDSSGNILMRRHMKNNSQIDFNKLPAGTYILIINDSISHKIIKT